MTYPWMRGDTLRADDLNAAVAGSVQKVGDTMVGPLIASRDPVSTREVATKAYVDARIGPGSQATVVVSDTPPVGPTANALWYDSVGLQLYIYYNDGNSTQWVPAATLPANSLQLGQIGALTFFGAPTFTTNPGGTAWRGSLLQAIQPLIVGGVYAKLASCVVGATYQACIASYTVINGISGTVSNVVLSDTAQPSLTAAATLQFKFSSPVAIAANAIFVAMIGRTDSTGAYVLPITNSNVNSSIPGCYDCSSTVNIASATISNGATLTNVAGTIAYCGITGWRQ